MGMLTFSHTSETSHCPTICPHQKGALVAYYAGRECTDEQHVEIQYVEDTNILAAHKFMLKSGNPVLIPTQKDEAILIFSYFNDSNSIFKDGTEKPNKPVERWEYCLNWKMRIRYNDGKIECGDPVQLEIQPQIGLLMRCNPIKIKNYWLLPYYHEYGHYGAIARSENGWDWKEIGRIGFQPESSPKEQAYFGKLIQPTLWHDRKNIYALCRDVTPTRKAWFAWSTDRGIKWHLLSTDIDNYNNSIVAIDNFSRKPWIIWNKGFGRLALCLGKWNMNTGEITSEKQLNPPGTKAAYPNYCWIEDQLHIVHTQDNRIIHHIIDKEMLHD